MAAVADQVDGSSRQRRHRRFPGHGGGDSHRRRRHAPVADLAHSGHCQSRALVRQPADADRPALRPGTAAQHHCQFPRTGEIHRRLYRPLSRCDPRRLAVIPNLSGHGSHRRCAVQARKPRQSPAADRRRQCDRRGSLPRPAYRPPAQDRGRAAHARSLQRYTRQVLSRLYRRVASDRQGNAGRICQV